VIQKLFFFDKYWIFYDFFETATFPILEA